MDKPDKNVILQFENVEYSYGKKTVLKNLSFKVYQGQKAAIAGASGIGKTTVLNLLMGFISPDTGIIRVNGEVVEAENIQSIRKQLCWLPQRLDIGQGTVAGAIEFIMSMQRNKVIEQKEPDTLALFRKLSLDPELLKQKIRDLSEGQRQRVGLVICLKLKRRLMLLDEPTSALDAAAREKVVHAVFEDSESTVLAATHDQYWLNHCNNVITIE